MAGELSSPTNVSAHSCPSAAWMPKTGPRTAAGRPAASGGGLKLHSGLSVRLRSMAASSPVLAPIAKSPPPGRSAAAVQCTGSPTPPPTPSAPGGRNDRPARDGCRGSSNAKPSSSPSGLTTAPQGVKPSTWHGHSATIGSAGVPKSRCAAPAAQAASRPPRSRACRLHSLPSVATRRREGGAFVPLAEKSTTCRPCAVVTMRRELSSMSSMPARTRSPGGGAGTDTTVLQSPRLTKRSFLSERAASRPSEYRAAKTSVSQPNLR
mmetsp:Transcript_109296/g.337450  ORF Transcript_109296/g.337450 Transcript_109296/m.337450 type:complete len:265 (+) Transcript_109296:310-1104(+)